jgi:uncharacterized phiE125 gp8 family phage protein
MALQIVTGPSADPIDLVEAKLHLRVTFTDDDLLIKALIRAATQYAQDYLQKKLVAQRVRMVVDAFPSSSMLGAPYNRPYSRPANALYLEAGPVQNVVSVGYTAMDGTAQVAPSSGYIVDYASDPVRITPVFGQIWPIPIIQIGAVNVLMDVGYAAPIKADVTANTVTVSGWPTLAVGAAVRFSNSGGALPAPLQEQTDYYVLTNPSAGVYTLSATVAGATIDITDTGTGTSFLGEVPEGIKGWLKLRIGSFYENREELSNGNLQPLPYVDRLLDGYKTWQF